MALALEIRKVTRVIHTTSSLECNCRERSGLIRLSMAFVEESDIGTYSLRYFNFIFSVVRMQNISCLMGVHKVCNMYTKFEGFDF